MSKKIKLELTGQQLATFNQVWSIEQKELMPLLLGCGGLSDKMDKMTLLIAKEVGVKFLKKEIERKAKASFTLKEYEGIAVLWYLGLVIDHLDRYQSHDVYYLELVSRIYRVLDQKTV